MAGVNSPQSPQQDAHIARRANGTYVRLDARLVLVPKNRCHTTSHEGVMRPDGVRSLCGRISADDGRRRFHLRGTDCDDPQPVTCPRCVFTTRVCARCGKPISRRQSYMSTADGHWQHINACG